MLSFSKSLFIASMTCCTLVAAPPALYEESELPEHQLPDPLKFEDGQPVQSATDWARRRKEIHSAFEHEVYGRSPDAGSPVQAREISRDNNALDGTATRREVEITLVGGEQPVVMTMLIYQPKLDRPAPAFLTLNFKGNHSIQADPGIRLNPNWMRPGDGVVKNKSTEETRGVASSRWPVKMIISRGYALCTIYYGDIDPDFDDEFQNGVHPHFAEFKQNRSDAGGSIAAWAWGLSRGLDYLGKDRSIDESKVAVMGHSRLGKTSLWAGAHDPRFALVISNNSGCGGAALSRRRYGESVTRINEAFPHWFCDNFTKYNHNENVCPVDQHELIALVAPRPVYVASAVGDQWADPRGEFLSCLHADPVYRLLGTDGLGGANPPQEPPAVDQPLKSGHIGYHIRTGKHDVTDFDWQQYLDFADLHFK